VSSAVAAPALSIELARRLFAWDAWANAETLASLRAAEPAPESAIRTLAHVAGASWLWISRLEDEPSPLAVWPNLGVARIAEELDAAARAWAAYLARLTPASHARSISNTNSKGEPWTSRVEDVLLHVPYHGEHHRGQIATALRDAGAEPAYTDFIHAARSGRLG
jgi:uncharacterized damage-inducible protein DinB